MGLANLWIRSDAVPKQGSDGLSLKGGGRFLVEAQSTMGERESGRMWVVLAISKGEKDELQWLNAHR
jgi:hypothetical protein